MTHPLRPRRNNPLIKHEDFGPDRSLLRLLAMLGSQRRRGRQVVVGTVLVLVVCGLGDAAAATKRPRLARPRAGAQLVVGPTVVPLGSEVTACNYFRLRTKHDMAVNKIDIKVQGGSHHVHLYRPNDPAYTVPDGSETCNYALDFEKWGLILASQGGRLRWRLPAGVAFHFAAGEQLAAQTHYVDTGLLNTDGAGWSIVNLHSIPERKVTAWAGSFFGQDRDVVVPPDASLPPGAVTTTTTRCVFPKPIKVLGITGHYHFRGTRFTASAWDGTTTGPQIYEARGYREPPFTRFGDTTPSPEIPGIEWTCTYHNPTDKTHTFGPFTEDNEHCNLFMFYYPAATTHEFMTCVQEHSVTTVAVHGN
jgi:Copper type II ascorbate-dependent monooxygenase, C-terminal domain